MKISKREILLFILAFILNVNWLSAGEAQLNESLGKLTNFQKNDQVIKINATNAYVEVSIYTSSIIRIRIDKKEFKDDFSYAVISKPLKTTFNIQEEADRYIVTTDSVKLEITKNPVRFRFLTLDNKLINEDDPAFGTSYIGEEVTTYKKIQPNERFIGLGEKTGNLDRRGSGYTNWNTDYFGYGTNDDPLYVSIPFYIGIHNNMNYGLFLDNTYKSHFNFGASNDRFSSFTAESGEMNYYFIYHKNVADIVTSYSALTGRMKLPPMWSLGFQQCRYSYYPDTEVLTVAKTFRAKKIPADVIYLDIHYMDAYKVFTWHPTRFPNPKKMLSELKEMGFHTTVIVDPGIKIEKGYPFFEQGVKENIFVKYPDKTNYAGQVWPGWCHFPDFTNPAARTWWGKSFKGYVDMGLDGFWNDMNEIATWGNRLPNLMEFNYDGHHATTKSSRNIYGMQMARATFEGTKELLGGKRPFVLTRAGFSGVQRYAAVWTGDNSSNDDHMLAGVRLVNSLGVSGVTNAGVDVGGFTGGVPVKLYTRWMSIGAFTPFFRAHTAINTKDAEPWTFGEEAEEITRNYIQLRYNLMPYIYSSFYESTQNGLPVSRTLAINYTHDKNIYEGTFQNQYLFGNSIMVAPFVSYVDLGKVYLPKGNWYDFYNDKPFKGSEQITVETPIDRLPLFVKGGSIIPVQSPIQSMKEKPSDTLMIHIYKGEESNKLVYYEDDGETYDNEKGTFYKRLMVYQPNENHFTLEPSEGSYASKFKNLKCIFHGFDLGTEISVNDTKVKVSTEYFSFLNPITRIDPSAAGGGYSSIKDGKDVQTNKYIIISNKSSKIDIKF
jgi:alpha-glucosidase